MTWTANTDRIESPAVVGLGSVWAASRTGLYRLDAITGRVQATIPVKDAAAELAVGGGYLWMVSFRETTTGEVYELFKIDPRTARIVKQTEARRASRQPLVRERRALDGPSLPDRQRDPGRPGHSVGTGVRDQPRDGATVTAWGPATEGAARYRWSFDVSKLLAVTTAAAHAATPPSKLDLRALPVPPPTFSSLPPNWRSFATPGELTPRGARAGVFATSWPYRLATFDGPAVM